MHIIFDYWLTQMTAEFQIETFDLKKLKSDKLYMFNCKVKYLQYGGYVNLRDTPAIFNIYYRPNQAAQWQAVENVNPTFKWTAYIDGKFNVYKGTLAKKDFKKQKLDKKKFFNCKVSVNNIVKEKCYNGSSS